MHPQSSFSMQILYLEVLDCSSSVDHSPDPCHATFPSLLGSTWICLVTVESDSLGLNHWRVLSAAFTHPGGSSYSWSLVLQEIQMNVQQVTSVLSVIFCID